MSDQVVDAVEMRSRLANLKMSEAEILREAAQIEKTLAEKEGEAQRIRLQINNISRGMVTGNYVSDPTTKTAQFTLPGGGRATAPVIKAEQVGKTKKRPGRPTRQQLESAGGVSGQKSMPVIIEEILSANKDGLSLAEIVDAVRQQGYVSLSKKPRTMVEQALNRLKDKEKILRDQDSMKYMLRDAA